jgi:N-acyl homoserine lactone hydrolase
VKTAKLLCAAAMAASPFPALAQEPAPDIEMWRLDCGTIDLSDTAPFSDAHLYDGEKRSMVDSCYLIRHGAEYLLWDTGLPSALKGQQVTEWVFTLSVRTTIAEQLEQLGLTPASITKVGISHYHDDHIGQAAEFPHAELLIGAKDAEAITSGRMEETRAQLAPWLAEGAGGKLRQRNGDLDVFGDGSVVIKSMPGHTPGHATLLVRLPEAGNVLLSGDLYHFEEQIANRGVPTFNTDRADTLASFERFNAMADALDATVIIQHDPRHIGRLPSFPDSAQ